MSSESQLQYGAANLANRSRILFPRWLVVMVLMLILGGAGFVRVRLIDLPLERDEGEYAYAGQLMLQGVPPYKLAYNMKLPGTYAAYALIMAAFGQTIRGIHIGLILVNSITILLLYFLGRRLFGQICGLVAAACFALLTLSNSVLGLAAHATHFVVLFAVAGTLLLLRSVESRRLITFFWCGLLFGLAFVMKQPGVFFALFAGLFLLWNETRRHPAVRINSIQRLAVFCASALLPFVLTILILAVAGVFNRFWFWTFSYARDYVANLSPWSGWGMFKNTAWRILAAAPGIWLLAALSIPVAFSSRNKRSSVLFLFAFSAASFATICPGFYFREHYFITLIPAIAVFTGAGLQILCENIVSRNQSGFWLVLPAVAFLAACSESVYKHRVLFWRLSPNDAARAVYGENPFPEAVEIARYIREHSPPGSRVAVLGSEPEIYFYSHRHSATGYIYTYALMESQKYAATMQHQMIAEIEATKPEFVVLVNVASSWLAHAESDKLIFAWFEKYGATHLQTVGLIDIFTDRPSIYRWDDKAIAVAPQSKASIRIYKRNDLL